MAMIHQAGFDRNTGIPNQLQQRASWTVRLTPELEQAWMKWHETWTDGSEA